MKYDSFILLVIAILLIWLGASEKGREIVQVLRGKAAGAVTPGNWSSAPGAGGGFSAGGGKGAGGGSGGTAG